MNRRGQMSNSQREQLRQQLQQSQHRISEDITQFGFVLGAIIILTYIARVPTFLTMSLLTGTVLAYGLFKYLETGMLRRIADDVESGRVRYIEGIIQLKAQRANYRLSVRAQRYRTRIEERLYRQLRHGGYYRLYLAERSGLLLSLEAWENAA